MSKYRMGDLATSARELISGRYNLIPKQKNWNNLPSPFNAFNIWSFNGTIYHSNKDRGHFRLDGDTWVEYVWPGFNAFNGRDVYKYNDTYYVSDYYNGTYKHYKLVNGVWNQFETLNNVSGRNVWSPYKDNSVLYGTENGITYIFNEDRGFIEYPIISSENSPFAGSMMWSDGERIFHGNYELQNYKYVPFTWNIDMPLYPSIIAFNDCVFLTRLVLPSTENYVLVGNNFLPYDLPDGSYAGDFWSDGTYIYCTSNSNLSTFSYMLEPVLDSYFDYDLPSVNNTVTINLYMNNSEKNVIGKSLTSVRNLNGTFKQEADMVNLSIQVDLSTVPNFNYLRVPLFNRYYFVDNIVNIRDDLWEISCHVDVLESFKDTIMSTYGLIERNEFEFNPKIIDHLRVIEQGVTTEVLTGGMTLETVLNAGVPQTMTETSPRFMLVGTFMSLEGEIT